MTSNIAPIMRHLSLMASFGNRVEKLHERGSLDAAIALGLSPSTHTMRPARAIGHDLERNGHAAKHFRR
jgi:hypothetical protein